MATLTAMELERQQRMAENQRRMLELGLQQMADDMQQASAVPQPAKKKRANTKAVADPDAPPEPMRRSKRNEGREAPNYCMFSERSSSPVARRLRDGPLVKEGECEEVYGMEHVLALGSHQREWEMFTDGYNSSGERIYDAENGSSCHQCRQKTLGQHTSCSRCKSGLGVLCGDCLFARYGENVEEANANKDWVCPCCRDLCNCSRHRKKRKWEATGQLHRSVKARGYLSVAHYLVLNKVGSLEAKRAALDSGMCPPDLAEKLRQEISAAEQEVAAQAQEAGSGAAAEAEAEETAARWGQGLGDDAGKQGAGKRGRKQQQQLRGSAEPAAAAAAAVMEPSTASKGAVAPASPGAGDPAEEVALGSHRAAAAAAAMAPAAAEAVVAAAAAAGVVKKGVEGRRRGGATLEGLVDAPAGKRLGRS